MAAVEFRPEIVEGMIARSAVKSNELHQTKHDCSTDATCNGQSQNPCEKDGHEEFPIDILTRARTTDKDHRSDFTVGRADRKTEVRGRENGQGGSDLDTESAG